jgi:transposase
MAHIIGSKFDDHPPLYRQAGIYAREGVPLETSTRSGWVGLAAVVGPWSRQDKDRRPADLCAR